MTREKVHTLSLVIEEGHPNKSMQSKQSTLKSEKPQKKRFTMLSAILPYTIVYFVTETFYIWDICKEIYCFIEMSYS